MSTPDTGTAAAAVTIHQSATESMRDLIGQQLEKARVGLFKIPDEAWSVYLAELSERLNEWAASGVPTPPNLNDLSGYGRIMALCHDAEPVALEKFLGAQTAFLVSKGLTGDAANRILLGVQWLYGSASAHQTDVAPLVARKVAEFRKIGAMIQAVQMIPTPVNGPARAGIRPPAPAEQDEREEVQAPAPVQVNVGLTPVTTTELAAAFDGLNGWNETTWRNRLGSASGLPWLLKARLTPGTQGGSAATWNPVIVASELVKRSPGHKRYVLGRFQSKHALKPWLDQLYEHVPSITEPT